MVIKEPNLVVASRPKFILEICFPNSSICAARFLFSLSAIRCVSSIHRARSTICSSMAPVDLSIAPVAEAISIVAIFSFRDVDMIPIELIESELSLLFELETLEKLGFLAR